MILLRFRIRPAHAATSPTLVFTAHIGPACPASIGPPSLAPLRRARTLCRSRLPIHTLGLRPTADRFGVGRDVRAGSVHSMVRPDSCRLPSRASAALCSRFSPPRITPCASCATIRICASSASCYIRPLSLELRVLRALVAHNPSS